ncbi:hypothetical protein INT48_002403, partial [Thamnidium elegans]
MKYITLLPFGTFKKLKIHFLLAHGETVRHRSMSILSDGIYLMTEEQRVDVLINFAENDLLL